MLLRRSAGAGARSLGKSSGREAEYLTIIELDALRPADAVILAVGHGSYVEGGWPLIQKLLIGGSGLVLDIKMKFDRGSKPTGVELWRL